MFLFPFILDGGSGASLPYFMFVVMTIACLCLSVVIGASHDIPAVGGKTMSMAFVSPSITTATTSKATMTPSSSLIRRVRTIHHHYHRATIRNHVNDIMIPHHEEGDSNSLLPTATMEQVSLQSYNPLHQSITMGDQSLVERHLRQGKDYYYSLSPTHSLTYPILLLVLFLTHTSPHTIITQHSSSSFL